MCLLCRWAFVPSWKVIGRSPSKAFHRLRDGFLSRDRTPMIDRRSGTERQQLRAVAAIDVRKTLPAQGFPLKSDRWCSGAYRSRGAVHRSPNCTGGVGRACVSGHSGRVIDEIAVSHTQSRAGFTKVCAGYILPRENLPLFSLLLLWFWKNHGRFSAGHVLFSQDRTCSLPVIHDRGETIRTFCVGVYGHGKTTEGIPEPSYDFPLASYGPGSSSYCFS